MAILHSSFGRSIVIVFSFLLAVGGPAPGAGAQTTSGTLIGQVFGDNNAPLGGAKVTVVNENNGNTRATRTIADGSYTVSFLTPGSYTITASLDQYTEGSIKGFIIPLNATTPLNPPRITLSHAGATAPTTPNTGPTTPSTGPTATGPATGPRPSTGPAAQAELSPMINITDPTRRANFDHTQIVTLPLGGISEIRTFDELALLAPGVAPPPYTPGVRGPGVGFGIGTAGEFSVNGSRSRSNNFTVDGSDNNDIDVGVRRQGFVALVPSRSNLFRNSRFQHCCGMPSRARPSDHKSMLYPKAAETGITARLMIFSLTPDSMPGTSSITPGARLRSRATRPDLFLEGQ